MNRSLAMRCLKNFNSLVNVKKKTTTRTTMRNFYRTEISSAPSNNNKSRYNYLVKNTLQNWFLNQIELGGNIELYKTNPNTVELLKLIHKLESLENTKEFESTLRDFDVESCKHFCSISEADVLTILNKLTRIAPHRITRTEFYSKFIDKFMKEFEKEEYRDKDDKKLVNIIFLIGLKKRNGARELNFFLNKLTDFSLLSLVEKAIVSTAAFKCGVKLDRDKISKVEDEVNENIEALLTAPQIFVSLIKVLRHAGPSEEFSLAHVSRAILDKSRERRYRISIAVPLLALYAEMLEAEREVIERLVDDSVADISSEGKNIGRCKDDFFLANEVRIKDVDRMLWAASRLAHKFSDRNIEEVDKFMERKLSKLLNKPETICGMLLSLWIMGYKRFKLIEYCFEMKIFEKKFFSSSHKNRARFNLLVDCLRLERPDLKIPDYCKKSIEKLPKIKPCKELITVSQLLICLGEGLQIRETNIECPIESLRIYGITTRHRILGFIHLDILNEITCLRESKTPNGLMALKLRLVEAMGYHSIILDHGGLTKMEDTVTRIEKCLESLLENQKKKEKRKITKS